MAGLAPGNPGKLTPEVQAKIVEALNACPFYEPAARYAGVSHAAVHDWLKRGRRYRQAILAEDDGHLDQLSQRLWRQADALWNAGQRQSAYAVLARLDARLDRSTETKYLLFLEAVEEARGKVEIELSALVRKGAREDPNLALRMLKAAFPSRWADNRQVVTEDGDTVDVDELVAQKQEQAHDLLRSVRGRLSG